MPQYDINLTYIYVFRTISSLTFQIPFYCMLSYSCFFKCHIQFCLQVLITFSPWNTPFFFFIIPTSLQLASTFHPLIELNLLNLIQPLRFQAYTYNMLQLICKFNFPPLGSLGQGLYCIYFGIFGGYMVISDKRNE